MTTKKKRSTKKIKKETFEDVQRWSREGRTDPKGLSRSLPGLAAKVRDGKVDPDSLASSLALAKLQADIPSTFFSFKGNPNQKIDMKEFLPAVLASMACPDDEEMTYQFRCDFMRELQVSNSVVESFGDFAACSPVLSALLHQVFDQVCDKWEARIIQKTGRPLKDTCPIYKVTQEEFVERSREFISNNMDIDPERLRTMMCKGKETKMQYRNVKAAAQGVAEGLDKFRSVCWECGKQTPDTKKCTACKAARYCSKECQVAAWRGGHREACKEMKISYELFMDNYYCVDDAVRRGVICSGCKVKPCPEVDYSTMAMMNLKEMRTYHKERRPDDGIGPRMDIFYANLAHIVSGGSHWMFPDDTPSSAFANWSAFQNSQCEIEDWEMQYIMLSAMMLAHDISNAYNDAASRFANFCKKELLRVSEDRKLMPVKRYMRIYVTAAAPFDDLSNTYYFRSLFVTKSFGILKDGYHKQVYLDLNTFFKH